MKKKAKLCKVLENIKTYWIEFHDKYKPSDYIFWSILILFLFYYIDYNNLINQYFNNIGFTSKFITGYFLLLIGIALLIKFRIVKMLNYNLINRLDQIMIISFISSILIQILVEIGYENITRFNYFPIIIIIICIVIIFYRVKRLENVSRFIESSVVDLKDIYEGTLETNKPFLIRETDVEYDLLARNFIIKDLISWLYSYQSNERFVIGIEGEWGSGKSTLINNILIKLKDKNKDKNNKKGEKNIEEFIIIDDFEPWISENKTSLLENLLNKILKDSTLEISDNDANKIVANVMNLVLGKKIPFDIKLKNSEIEYSSNKITSDINKVLSRNNQKIIFVIDNLERLSSDNVLLLLNVIQNVLNFNNLIVFLSYDKVELEKVLEQESISSGYLNKLVQKKITLSIPNTKQLTDLYVKTIENLANVLKFETENIDEINGIIKILVDNNQLDMREFKRLLNSIFIPLFRNKLDKYLMDLLVINYIEFSNSNLFNEIYLNADKFISEDMSIGLKVLVKSDEQYDLYLNEYYKSLEKQVISGTHELKLLAMIFPNIYNYLYNNGENYKYVISGGSGEEYMQIQRDKRIASGKYFDLYFNLEINEDSKIINSITNFVEENNNGKKAITQEITSILEMTAKQQYDYFNSFQYYIDKLNDLYLKDIVKKLFLNYLNFDYYVGSYNFTTSERIAVVISKIFTKIETKNSIQIIDEFISDPKYLSFFIDIQYWLKRESMEGIDKIVEYIQNKLDILIDNILGSKKINLFDEHIYSKENALSILRYSDQRYEFKDYLKFNLNENTVYRIINDMIIVDTSLNDKTSYSLISNAKEYLNIADINEILETRKPENELEDLIIAVYKSYLTAETDKNKESEGVSTLTYIDLKRV